MKRLPPTWLILLAMLAGCERAPEPETPPAAPLPPGQVDLSASARRQITLTTEAVRHQRLAAHQQVLGQIIARPEAESLVHAPIHGRVVALHATVGDRVEAGQVLAELASTELGEAQAAYLESEGQQTLTRQEQARQRALFKADLASQKELDEAAQALALGQLRLRTAREKLRVLGMSEAEIARIAQRGHVEPRTMLRAPRAGTVLAREVSLGAHVGPEEGHPMFRLLDMSVLRVEAELPERDLNGITAGQAASVSLPALGDQPLAGRVLRLAPLLNPDSRTGKALIELPNPSGRLRPGMSCQVRIRTGTRLATAVPATAVQREDQHAYVYVVLSDTRFQEREVRLGGRHGELYEVLAGLKAGETVVGEGSFDLRSQAHKAMFGGE